MIRRRNLWDLVLFASCGIGGLLVFFGVVRLLYLTGMSQPHVEDVLVIVGFLAIVAVGTLSVRVTLLRLGDAVAEYRGRRGDRS